MILILKLTLSHFLDLLMWTIVSERSIRLLGSKYKNHFNQLGEMAETKFSLGYMLISSKGIGRKKRINIVVAVISIESICYHSLQFSTYNYFG